MKKIVSALLLSMTIGGAFAQDQKNVIQAGIGFGNTLEYYGGAKGMPTLNFTYERILPFKAGPGYFGAGLTTSFRTVKWDGIYVADEDGNGKWKHSNAIIALRAAYHLNSDFIKVENLDLYAGMQVGPRFTTSKYGDTKYKDNGVHFGCIAGARYFFTKGFGAYSEIGYDVTWIKIGIAGRF